MTVEELSMSAEDGVKPRGGLSLEEEALWYAKAGEWEKAHELCQNIPGRNGCWIHAWLHREEGDTGNAAYWYARAGVPMPAADVTSGEEWFSIAGEMVGG